MSGSQTPAGLTNRCLLSLPPLQLQRLLPVLEPVPLIRRSVLAHADERVEQLYFVTRGLISLMKTMQDGRTVEIGAIGIEGVTDATALFGLDHTFLDTMVQVPGTALRIRADMLRIAMQHDPTLLGVMQRYIRFSYHQLAQTAACNRLHSLEQRCCRWLLVAHDSALADRFPITHDFLAMMLGVQRAGVTIAANALRDAGLIRYTHGMVTIADRAGLEHAACECHAALSGELDTLFPRKLPPALARLG